MFDLNNIDNLKLSNFLNEKLNLNNITHYKFGTMNNKLVRISTARLKWINYEYETFHTKSHKNLSDGRNYITNLVVEFLEQEYNYKIIKI